MRQEKEIKGFQIGKEEVKLSLFVDDTKRYIENPQDATKKLLDVINEFNTFQDTKLIYRNPLHSYTLIMNYQKEKLRKHSHLQSH